MKPLLILIAALALSGCAAEMLSTDRIRESTARLLNQPASAVTISDGRTTGR